MALISFSQVFDAGDYPGPAILGVGAATGIAIGARRLGLGSLATLLASAAGLLVYLVLIFQARHSLWGLPTPEAVSALGRSLQRAYDHSRVDFAPVPIRPGYEVMIVAALWASATVGELASFRWRRPVLSVILPIVLLSVSLVVGTGAATPFLALLFLAALLTYWALESSHRLRSWGRWVSAWSHHRNAEPASLSGGLARRLGATCLAAALVSPLFLPALGDGLVRWRSSFGSGSGSGSGSGTGVDPWVSILPSLVNQNPEVLFEVETETAAYYRTASLEVFDGTNWSEDAAARLVVGNTGDVGGPAPPPTHSDEVAQTIVSTGLSGSSLPSAPSAVKAFILDPTNDARLEGGLRFDRDSGNVYTENGISEGDRFQVISALPDVRYKQMLEATPEPPATARLDPLYYQPGVTVAPEVDALVDRWIEGTDNPYEELVAIQGQLRRFAYSLTPDAPEGDDYLTDFLIRSREGYCQQYSTAFALLARHLGYPSRVSVGFLPGDRDIGTGRYRVSGTDAHAWPEVYFSEFGWIAFEPTPRSEDGAVAPGYTSEPIGGGFGGFTAENIQNAFSDLGGRGQAAFGDVGEQAGGQDPIEGGLRGSEQGAGGNEARATQAWERAFRRVLTAAALGLLAFLLLVPLLKEARIRRRYARASAPDEAAASAFVHFAEEAAELASARHPWESASSFAARLRDEGALADHSALRLAAIYEAAAYGAESISELQAEEAKRLARRVRGQLWSRATWTARLARLFSYRLGVGAAALSFRGRRAALGTSGLPG